MSERQKLDFDGYLDGQINRYCSEPTEQELIDRASDYEELPAWSEYRKIYGKDWTDDLYMILDGLATTWINSVSFYNNEAAGSFPDEINRINFRKGLRKKTIKSILRTFGQKFHGDDEALFVLYDQLLEYQERVEREAEQKRIERNKLAEDERVF